MYSAADIHNHQAKQPNIDLPNDPSIHGFNPDANPNSQNATIEPSDNNQYRSANANIPPYQRLENVEPGVNYLNKGKKHSVPRIDIKGRPSQMAHQRLAPRSSRRLSSRSSRDGRANLMQVNVMPCLKQAFKEKQQQD